MASRGTTSFLGDRARDTFLDTPPHNDVIIRTLRSAEVSSILEPPGCSRQDRKHPDGMTLGPEGSLWCGT